MTLALLGALAAAVAYGAATVVQALGVRRLAGHSPRQLGPWLRAGWPYAAGLGLDLLGFVASIGALLRLPLFLVESVVASSVAVTALLSVLVLGVRLARLEVAALVGVGVGLVLLALSAAEGPGRDVSRAAGWAVLGAAALVAALLLWGRRTTRDDLGAALLGVAAGLGFGGVGVAARVLPGGGHWGWSTLAEPALWAIAAHGVLATVAFGYALARGRVTTVATIAFATETVVPALVGLVWLGDRVRAGTAPLAVTGFVVTLAGCVALARHAEVSAAEDPAREATVA